MTAQPTDLLDIARVDIARVRRTLGALGISVYTDAAPNVRKLAAHFEWLARQHAEILIACDVCGYASPASDECAFCGGGADRKTRAREKRIPIEVTTNEKEVADQVLAVLVEHDGTLYARAGRLVSIVVDNAKTIPGSQPAPRIRAFSRPNLRERISQRVSLRQGRDKQHVPDWLVSAIFERGEYAGVRPIVGVLETPTIRADGSLLSEPGYDAATGLYYSPAAQYPTIPDAPTQEDAARAAGELLEVISDFPFSSAAHRSAWLALTLTLICRHAIHGPTPLFVFDGTVAGSGKTLASDAAAWIALGRAASKMPPIEDDAEMRKRLTAIVLEGEAYAVLDNCADFVGSPSLDMMLTSTTWSDRILGKSATVGRVAIHAVLAATGNNLVIAFDTLRRSIHLRLVAQHECPELRDDFAHPDLIGWVRDERPRLVAAALTMLRAYYAAGSPSTHLPAFGSYEAWSTIVRQAIVYAGQPDPCASRIGLTSSADSERAQLGRLLRAWLKEFPLGATVKTALKTIASDEKASTFVRQHDALATALAEIAPPRPGTTALSARSIGKRLHALRERVAGGLVLRRGREVADGAVWTVDEVDGFGGGDGDVSTGSLRGSSDDDGGNTPITPRKPMRKRSEVARLRKLHGDPHDV